ncbi:MAG: hypothetical protein OQJ84_10340, partial [Xanthomonadales bacterium]|nr:hypothetical protein [Xanthomonadales bacterium]
MISRLPLALLVLILASCATTQSTTPEPETEVVAAAQEDLPKGEGESIDEHLYVPEPVEPEPATEAPRVYNNVWVRLIDRFALPNCAEQEVSLRWANWYADHDEYMKRVMKRAQPWIYFIAEELEQRGMPGELALLPVVESAFDPFAYSSGR